ncbi:MAG: SRPBCC domain-containing protein [Pseudomonadota bacterium]
MWTVIKWAIPTIVLIALVGALLTKKTFRIEHDVAAPPEVVWQVLMDTAAYPEWNPVFIAVDGDYVEGASVVNTVRDPSVSETDMRAKVRTVSAAAELRQSGGMPGIITFDHRWLLEPIDGGTRIVQHETDRGIGLWFWNSDWIEPAYTKTSEALGRRAEALTR